jgi:hypothetical protein
MAGSVSEVFENAVMERVGSAFHAALLRQPTVQDPRRPRPGRCSLPNVPTSENREYNYRVFSSGDHALMLS